MIKDYKYLKKFEKDLIKNSNMSYDQKLSLYEAMWQEGVELGVLPLKDPLDGIDKDFEIARILNSCSKK